MSQTATDTGRMSVECVLAQRPEYRGVHGECRQTEDVPLPHSMGLLLMRCCTCPCHRQGEGVGGEGRNSA
ncbi:hypothetical protein ADL12_04510 [Streptomyces regalis]|uniref:Uncharacterized protein n=1 Tax=Streptomyces regalis TaxID=68262 RepID=A0A0X3VJV9_9ACTN|nr:hypothetical protein ADL12_04510 [Streptomyces regalis]